MSSRHLVYVTFDDGNTLETEINGTRGEIVSYYLDNPDGFELVEGKPNAKATSVAFIMHPEAQP